MIFLLNKTRWKSIGATSVYKKAKDGEKAGTQLWSVATPPEIYSVFKSSKQLTHTQDMHSLIPAIQNWRLGKLNFERRTYH